MSLRRDLALDCAERHPDDAAAVLESLGPDESAEFLASVPVEIAVHVLHRTTAHPAAAILARLESGRAAEIVAGLPVDVAASYLRLLDGELRVPILAGLDPGRARSVRALLRFRERTAGALMDPEVLALPADLTVREAVQRVQKSADKARYNLYVVDRDDRLAGVFNLRELLLAEPNEHLSRIMHPEVIRIRAEVDQRTVIDHPGWREVHALPVVDEEGVYLGAIRYRTLRQLEEEQQVNASGEDVASQALGDLFFTGLAGLLDALTGNSTRDESSQRGSGNGGE